MPQADPPFRWESFGRQVQSAVSPEGDVADVVPPQPSQGRASWAWTVVGRDYGASNRSARREGTAPSEAAAKRAAEAALLDLWRARRRLQIGW